MQTLRTKGERLKCRAEDIIIESEDAKFRSRKKRKREVENWLENVEKKTRELQNLEQDVEQSGTISGLLTGLGRRAENMIKEMDELVEQGKFSGGHFLDVHESKGEPFLTTKLMGEAFQNNLQKILELLKKDDVFSIGIYGMAGVGKTTLATHIHNLLLEESKNIFWVTVSDGCSIRKLQDMIAKTVLKQDLTNEHDKRKRAAELSRALRKRDKCVLILDDVWDSFPLEDVGICRKENGCKLILTTRFSNVCGRMACDKNIEVVSLPEEEAWDLFKDTLGHGLALSPNIEKVALSVAKRCAGLPLGIVTMAGSMRGVNDIHEWRNVLEELESRITGQRDMQNKVFPLLKLSYDRLDAELQRCFLYCTLYPEDEKIERNELITFFIVEGIIDRKKTMQAKFDKGHSLLNKLEHACLLESCKNSRGERSVKMHDLTREMALEITKVSPRFMVAAGHEKQDGLGWMEDLEKVSLMRCIINFPEGMSPRCPKLSTLLCSHNHDLMEIPHSFFVHMPALRVLDLSDTKICELPNSILNLENLTGLFLKDCILLKYVPPLGNLMVLQVLNLSRTSIEEVPQGMQRLTGLTSFFLEYCYELKYVPPLGNLTALQVLNLSGTSIEEVPQGMERLTSLTGLFLENCAQLKYVPPLGNLTALQVLNLSGTSIEEVPQGMEMLVNLNHLYIENMRDKFTFPTGILHRLSRLQVLRLDQYGKQEKRSGELKELTLLEEIKFQMYDICDFKQFVKSQCFMQLSLCDIAIGGLLMGVGRWPVSHYTKEDQFVSMSNISLEGHGGKVVAALLPRDIQECEIRCCDEIEYIVRFPFSNEIEVEEDSGEESQCVPFQSLEILRLCFLKNLRAFIKWGRQGGERVIMPVPADTFSNLKVLRIQSCNKIKNLFQPGLLQYLPNLEHICAVSCSGMEEIIAEDDEGMGACNSNNNNPTTFSLPKLKKLELICLPLLKCIYKEVMACDSIETITIVECRQLKRVQFSLPHALQRIELDTEGVEWWESLEWDHPNDRNVLQPFVEFTFKRYEKHLKST
ncbi:hypothetical protein F0562_029284 [Nyssa sinensis]|uniref:AAA+ ATPase domain-containing protein n=1 Tax=Nyssa sinensis TaxID=561372 RepID=A0A5J5B3M8_9ASTE|nr:hypothetical protein F0562_029284 [Nyssa sinensis]